MRRTGRFGVSVLARRHAEFAAAAAAPGSDRFTGVDWELSAGGVPVLPDALATLDCAIVAEHPAGDHSIVVGLVEDLRVGPTADPVVFFAGRFLGLGEHPARP
jgi:flavin reductase (DIM6/NTAB) family NADH-FMN oxidoreductase RutF